MSWRAAAGLRSWLLQRLSAVYIVVFLLALVFAWGGASVSFDTWRAWVAHPLVNVGLMLFLLALLGHAWVGTRDVVMDYVKPVQLRYLVLIGVGLALVGLAIWSLRIVLLVTLK